MRAVGVVSVNLALLLSAGAAVAAEVASPRPAAPGQARQPLVAAATTVDKAAPTLPVFQGLSQFGTLALLGPVQLLSAGTQMIYDANLPSTVGNTAEMNGLALSPTTGILYVVGYTSNPYTSYLGRLDFTTGVETTIGPIPGQVITDIAFDAAGNLYALTDNGSGTNPHSLLSIATATAASSVLAVLNSHGGEVEHGDGGVGGGLAFNAADGNLYYADQDSNGKLFVDRITIGTFEQTNVLSSQTTLQPVGMGFTEGELWVYDGYNWGYVDPTNFASDLTVLETHTTVPTPLGNGFWYSPIGIMPSSLPCVPSATAACLYNRFKVEVSYDATPANGSGPASVALESTESVKFTFFDPSNIEMILKVLNGCALGDHWWIFAGGLTNVGVSIKVTDTVHNTVKSYSSKKGDLFQAFADTAALPCP
jgi:hypothetical protein